MDNHKNIFLYYQSDIYIILFSWVLFSLYTNTFFYTKQHRYWSHEAPLSSIPTSLSGYLIEIKKQNKKNNKWEIQTQLKLKRANDIEKNIYSFSTNDDIIGSFNFVRQAFEKNIRLNADTAYQFRICSVSGFATEKMGDWST